MSALPISVWDTYGVRVRASKANPAAEHEDFRLLVGPFARALEELRAVVGPAGSARVIPLSPYRINEPGADPVQRELQQEWLQLHEPTEANAEALLAAGRSLPALEDALGRETARRYIAAAPRPDINTLFETGADPVQRELQQEWLQLHEPTEANAEALLAAGRSLPALEDALGRETARRYIAAAPRPDINTLFETGADPVQRELQQEWLQLHEPTEANAEALLAAGRSLPALEDALGRETARRYVAAAPPPDNSALFEPGAGAGQRELTKVWLQLHEPTEANAQAILLAAGRSLPALEDALGQETARRYVAAAPPPDNDELHAAWDDPAQHSLLREWCRLTEPTPKILRTMVAEGTTPTLLGDVLDGPATLSETELTAGVRAGDTWEEPLRQQYHAEGVDPGGRAPLSPQRALGVQRYQRGTPAERQQALGDAEERQFATLAQIYCPYAVRWPARNAARAAATPPKQRHKPKARQQPAAVRTPATSAAPRSTTRPKRRGPAEKQPDQQPAAAVRTAPAMPKQPPATPPSRPERPAANPIPAAGQQRSTNVPPTTLEVTAPPPASAERVARQQPTQPPASPAVVQPEATKAAPEAPPTTQTVPPASPAVVQPAAAKPTTAEPAKSPPPTNATPPPPVGVSAAAEPAAADTTQKKKARAPSPPRFKAPTGDQLLEAVLAGKDGARPYREMFRGATPSEDNVTSLRHEAIDPDLLRVALGRELARPWVPPLNGQYEKIRHHPNGLVNIERYWADQRTRWQHISGRVLAQQIREEVVPEGDMSTKTIAVAQNLLDKRWDTEPLADVALKALPFLKITDPHVDAAREEAELERMQPEISATHQKALEHYRGLSKQERRQTSEPTEEDAVATVRRSMVLRVIERIIKICRAALGLDLRIGGDPGVAPPPSRPSAPTPTLADKNRRKSVDTPGS